MARSLNRVMLIGHCGSDPEVRTLASGSKVANVSLATNRRVKDEETVEAALANMVSSADRLRALELMAKIGMTGERISIENVRARLQRTIEIIEEVLEPEAATALKQRLVDVWK